MATEPLSPAGPSWSGGQNGAKPVQAWPLKDDPIGPSLSRDGVQVAEGMASPSFDAFSLGTENIRCVYSGNDPDVWLLSALDTLEGDHWRVRNYQCDLDQHRAELIAMRHDLPRLSVINIAIDLYRLAADEPKAWTVCESGGIFTTAQYGCLTWARKGEGDGSDDPGARPDPPDGGTAGRSDLPGSGAGSPEGDPGQPVG